MKTLWGYLLKWVGIFGLIVTLFSNFTSLIQVSYWASIITRYWVEWSKLLWNYIFSYINLSIPSHIVAFLNANIFIITILVSTAIYKSSLPPDDFVVIWKNSPKRTWWRIAIWTILFFPYAIYIYIRYRKRNGVFCDLDIRKRNITRLWILYVVVILIFTIPQTNILAIDSDSRGEISGQIRGLSYLVFFLLGFTLNKVNVRAACNRILFSIVGLMIFALLNFISTLGIDTNPPH